MRPGTCLITLCLMAGELLVGIVLGMGVAILASGLQLAGQIIAQMSGMALADVLNPGSDNELPIFSSMLYMVGLAVFVVIGGHRALIDALMGTFAAVPIGHGGVTGNLGETVSTLMGESFALGLRAAAPAMVALLLATLVLGLIGRTLPQLNILVLGIWNQRLGDDGRAVRLDRRRGLVVSGIFRSALKTLKTLRCGERSTVPVAPRKGGHFAQQRQPMEESGEKSQDATPHRRQQAREEGQIVQSQDLAAAIILLAGLLLLLALGGGLVEFFGNFAHRQLGGDPWLSANPGLHCGAIANDVRRTGQGGVADSRGALGRGHRFAPGAIWIPVLAQSARARLQSRSIP